MTITYRWVNDDDGNQSRILKTDGNINGPVSNQEETVRLAEDYQSWVG